MRRPLMAGNWKMYKTPDQTTAFFEKFLPLVAETKHCDILICPPLVNIAAALAAASGGRVAIGAQNVFWENEGAYTGEVSAGMLAGAGCGWVIIGHSERRQYFGESNQSVLRRTRAALGAGLRPIVCVGERLEDREGGRTEAVLEEQFRDGIAPLAPE
ncbi:MAG: triose-phosphate isomerase family protein, partial [Bryobacteraceae bacterium]